MVAIAPYRDRNSDASRLISKWIFHHTNLGFKVSFYDRNGTYREVVEDSIYRYSSRYCESKHDICRHHQEYLSSMLTYHAYNLHEIVEFTNNTQRNTRTNQDKALN